MEEKYLDINIEFPEVRIALLETDWARKLLSKWLLSNMDTYSIASWWRETISDLAITRAYFW